MDPNYIPHQESVHYTQMLNSSPSCMTYNNQNNVVNNSVIYDEDHKPQQIAMNSPSSSSSVNINGDSCFHHHQHEESQYYSQQQQEPTTAIIPHPIVPYHSLVSASSNDSSTDSAPETTDFTLPTGNQSTQQEHQQPSSQFSVQLGNIQNNNFEQSHQHHQESSIMMTKYTNCSSSSTASSSLSSSSPPMSSSPQSASSSSTYNHRSLMKQQHRQLNEITLKWLEENYELCDGICLPRCLIYRHYLQFMHQLRPNSKPVGAAAFGKLVRQKFSKISTRRLGTRGQSKYHYYGISVRRSSPFFHEQASLVSYQNHGGSPANLLLKDLRYHQPKQMHQQPSMAHHHHHYSNKNEYYHQNMFYNNHSYFQHQNLVGYLDPSNHQSQNLIQSITGSFYPQQQQPAVAHQQLNYPSDNHSRFPASSIQAYDFSINNQQKETCQPVCIYPVYANQSQQSTSASTMNKRRNRTLFQESVYPLDSDLTNHHVQQSDEQQRKLSEDIEREFDLFCSPLSSSNHISPKTTAFSYFQSMYPRMEDIGPQNLPAEIPPHILATFLLMYHSHCQRLFDTFQLANVDEFRRSLLNFWQEMPQHLAPLMSSTFIFQVIDLVDTLLYRTMEDFLAQLSLMPDMSETFVSDLKLILFNMKKWLSCAFNLDNQQQSRMHHIILEHRMTASKLKNHSDSDSQNIDRQYQMVQNQVNEHILALLKIKTDTFDDFALGIQKQLKFIDMVKNCRQSIYQSRPNIQMLIDIQSLSSWNPQVEGGTSKSESFTTACSLLPMEILTSNVLDLVKIEMKHETIMMKQEESTADNKNLNVYYADGSNMSNTTSIDGHDYQKSWLSPPFCQCPTSESTMLEQIHQQFQYLIRYMQYSTDFNLVKILNWTKAMVDRNVLKCNIKCMERRSKILLYGINFYLTNVMRDLTVNLCKSLAIWNMIFLCIKEYLLLYLTRMDRYETKLSTLGLKRNNNFITNHHDVKIETLSPSLFPPSNDQQQQSYWYPSTCVSFESESGYSAEEDNSAAVIKQEKESNTTCTTNNKMMMMETYHDKDAGDEESNTDIINSKNFNQNILQAPAPPVYATSNGNVYACLN